MNKYYKVIQQDYEDLWCGKVKYLIHCYQKRGYGIKYKLWEVIYYRLRSRYAINKWEYPHVFQYYEISVNGNWRGDAPLWSKEDMRAFIKEKKLRSGDQLFIYYSKPRSMECRQPDASGSCYVIIKDRWEELWKFMGV